MSEICKIYLLYINTYVWHYMDGDSKFSRFFFRYFILTDIESLSVKEKIGIIAPLTIFVTLILLWMYVDSHDWRVLLLLFGVLVFYLGLFYPLMFYSKINEKYGYYSDIRFGSTYQFISKSLAYLIPGLVFIILIVGFILDNLTKGFFISFAFLLPFIALFFRTDVFNDNSSIEGEEVILGYHPSCYGLLNLGLGIYGYLAAYNLMNSDSILAMVLFVLTFIFQLLFVFPDQLNKVLFFEIRRKEGFLAYVCILVVCYVVLRFIIAGGNISSGIPVDLSFEGIVRKVFVWGSGIIFAILFLRLIKKMNND